MNRSPVHRSIRLITCLLSPWLFAVLGACSTTKPWINQSLQPGEVPLYDARRQFAEPARAIDMVVVASLSGGGSRAAALAHATLAELNDIKFPWNGRETSLTREIDLVTGVSGGSVAAAHFALHGYSQHLARFPADFLQVDFQGKLVNAVLTPSNVFRMTSPWFGRGQLLAEELDSLLFNKMTFGDLNQLEQRAALIIGATDLASGAEFDFASASLERLCTSIDKVPLSFAVAASSAVPLLFSPLTLRNFADECGGSLPNLRVDGKAHSARFRLRQSEQESFAQPDRRFVHLVDGGLSDNLGLRRIADNVGQVGGVRAALATLHEGYGAPVAPRRLVFVSVNSERGALLPINRKAEVPTTLEVLDAMVFGALGRYSRETELVFNDAINQWRDELRTDLAGDLREDIDVFLIEVDLADLKDLELRDRVLAISTSFRISEEDRALLRQAAKLSLMQSQELRRFLQSTDRHQVPETACH